MACPQAHNNNGAAMAATPGVSRGFRRSPGSGGCCGTMQVGARAGETATQVSRRAALAGPATSRQRRLIPALVPTGRAPTGSGPFLAPNRRGDLARDAALVGVTEVVVQRVGTVIVLAEVLELEAQHQGAIGPDLQRRVLHEGLDVARRQHEALVLVLDLEDILDAGAVVEVVAHLAEHAPAIRQAQPQGAHDFLLLV